MQVSKKSKKNSLYFSVLLESTYNLECLKKKMSLKGYFLSDIIDWKKWVT